MACPDIAEVDDEDERPPVITIGDEQIDESPFDPSLPDELYYEMMQQAASSSTGPPSPTSNNRLHDRFARLLNAQRVSRNVPPPASTSTHSLPSSHSWKSRFKLRRDNSLEDHSPERDALGSPKNEQERELATLIACTKRPRASLHLVPLDVAQAQEAIVRYPEGFELAEAKRAKAER